MEHTTAENITTEAIKKPRQSTFSWLFCLIVILFLTNVVGNKFLSGFNIDLTEHKIYSVSAATKQILKLTTNPITLRLYVSKKMFENYPYLLNYSARVEELLKIYARCNQEKIDLEVVELDQSANAKTQALNDGLLGVPVDGVEDALFFGLVVLNSTNKEVIPFLEPSKEPGLESSITKLIFNLSGINPKQYNYLLDDIPQREEYSRPLTRLNENQLFTNAKYKLRADTLNQKLQQLNTRMTAANDKKNSEVVELQQAAQAEEEIIRSELLATRNELIDLKRDLKAETAEIEQVVKLATIWGMPLAILLFMLLNWFYQARIANRHSCYWAKVLKRYE